MAFDLHNAYALFRKTVHLDSVPSMAPTIVTADQSYRLYVNGSYITRGPARGYQHTWPCDELDVAAHLRPGRNVIAIRAHNPGFSNYQYRFEGFAGLLFMGHWGDVEVVSDTSWRCRIQQGITRDTLPSSFQLFCQEHVDARIEPDDWMATDFDDSTWKGPSGSATPAASAAWNSAPWHNLEPRGIPQLKEENIKPSHLLGKGAGKASKTWHAPRNVVTVARSESLWHTPVSLTGTYEGSIQTDIAENDGSFASYLLDFGHTVVGNLRLRVDGAFGGEIIDALFSETIRTDANQGIAPNLDEKQVSLGSRLICRQGTTDHTFYHPYGFRYLVIRIRGCKASLIIHPSLISIGYPLTSEGEFHSSDAVLNRIWDACARTQRVCSLDAYVDTPWREQAQWWGDARVQAWNTFHLCNDARLFRRGIRCIACQTTPDGLTYGHAPTMAHHCILPDFTLIWILTLWDDYWQTGTLETFLEPENRETLLGALDYFRAFTDSTTGLIRHDPRHWLFLDWADMAKDGQPAVLSLWLLHALDMTARLYELATEVEEANGLRIWASTLRASLRRLVDPGDGLLWDGYGVTGDILPRKSIHTQTLALMTSLLPDGASRVAEQALLSFVEQLIPPSPREMQHGYPSFPLATPSVYWVTYVFTELDKRGYGEAIIRYIRKHWKCMAEHGTTWSQLKEYGGGQSHSHAWSAHPLYHLMQIVGGIRQTAPGWKSIEYRPLFWDVKASVTIPTPRGLIRSEWMSESSEVCDHLCHVRLQLPKGVTARINLPSVPIENVCGKMSWSIQLNAT